MSALAGLLDGSFAVREIVVLPAERPAVDSRPRAEYRLPNGETIRVILDHGEVPAATVTFEGRAGKPVTAVLVQS